MTAANYRTLEKLTLDLTNSYCTISGKNNAGKSCVIRLLSRLFRTRGSLPWVGDDRRFDYKEDKTQWVKSNVPIEIEYVLDLSRADDPALISFVEKIASTKIETAVTQLKISYVFSDGEPPVISAAIGGKVADEKAAKEIDKRIKDSDLLFLYNSTTRTEEYIYGPGGRRLFYEFLMSEEERKELDEAEMHVQRRMRRLAKEHKQGLGTILGRLTESVEVELSPPEGFASRHIPVGISLKDRNVEVPLNDWGSGTQNRTRILMAILQAKRIKTTESPDDRITPFVVIEEPESFLHPSAQAEFGRILRTLSVEFGIQIIVTTHSPYMLNQEEPASNILLSRAIRRGKAYETCVVDTSDDNWMAPFAEHLGIAPTEFASWRPVFSSYKSKVLLVEGQTDQEYFHYLQQHNCLEEKLSAEIEVVPYGGKDTLKNTLLVQFVLRKFDEVFITFDLDAEGDVKSALTRLGLKESRDFVGLGLSQPGKECIEGALPQRVLAAVNGREADLIMKLGGKDAGERRRAKEQLKQRYLEEFKRHSDYSKDELKEFTKMVRIINAKLSTPNKPMERTVRRRSSRPTAHR